MRTITATALLLTATTAHAGPVDGYWENLHELCGKAFEGELVHEPGDSMAGKRLVMHVRECTDERIRIPFIVGDNYSRTWVLTRHDDRVELRHDHRDEDGSPEEVTMYGGVSPNPGSAVGQIFPTDEQSQQILPDSWPSVWMMAMEPGETFTYYARRQGTTSYYHVVFDLTEAIDTPDAPWGWEE